MMCLIILATNTETLYHFFSDKIIFAAIAVDERMIFSNVSHIYKTMIALPFQSSLTMLVMQGWHINLPKNLLH